MELAQEKMYYCCCPKCGTKVHHGTPSKGINKCTNCGAIVLINISEEGQCTTQLRPKGPKPKSKK